MFEPLTLIPMGDAAGVILPEQVLAYLGVTVGDELLWAETPDGIELWAKHETHTDDGVDVARRVMARRRLALRALAK